MTEQAAPSDRSIVREGRLPISELAAEMQGGLSPFGEDVEFPLPTDRISYRHPTAEDRPHLAGDPVE
jgi:succinate dehydrogenase / fumarate reductase iron-sulfur subunit